MLIEVQCTCLKKNSLFTFQNAKKNNSGEPQDYGSGLWRSLGQWVSWLELELHGASTGLITSKGTLKGKRNRSELLDSHSQLSLQQPGCAVTLGPHRDFKCMPVAAHTSSHHADTSGVLLGLPARQPHLLHKFKATVPQPS